MKRFFIIIFLFALFSSQISKSNDIFNELKSKIEKEKNPEQKVRLYLELVDKQADYADPDIMMTIEKAYLLADSLGNPYLKAKTLYYKGMVWRIWSDINKSLEFSFSALKLFEELGKEQDYAETVRTIAETYRALNYLDLALANALKAEEIFLRLNDTLGLAKTYNRLAAIMFEKVFSYTNFNQLWKDDISVSNFFKQTYANKDLKMIYDSLIKYIDLSYYYSKLAKKIDLYVSTANIEGSFYGHIGNFEEAIRILEDARKKAIENGLMMDMPLLYHSIGVQYYNRKNYKKALEYAQKSYELSEKTNIPIYKILSTNLIHLIYADLGDFKSALKYATMSYENRLNYHNSKTDARIKVVQYENELRNKELQIAQNRRLTTILVVGFLIILSIIVTSLIAIARRNNKIYKLNKILIENNIMISEQKDELAEQKEKLEIANKEKDKFFSIIAHDLKNPVGSFRMTTNILKDSFEEYSKEDMREIVYLLKDSSDSLYALLENLLEWSRAQRGKINFIPVPTDMNLLAQTTYFMLNNQAALKNITLINNIPNNYSIVLDPNLITTVVRNLVSNAIKFTPDGGKIEIGIKEETDENVTFYISDTGVGIAKENIDKIFKIDSQVTTLGTNQEKGTGLGLILCKEFINMHNGDIWVESEVGKGTTFYIKIPKNIPAFEEKMESVN